MAWNNALGLIHINSTARPGMNNDGANKDDDVSDGYQKKNISQTYKGSAVMAQHKEFFMSIIKHEPSMVSSNFPAMMDRFFDSFWRTAPSFPVLDLDIDFDNGAMAPRIDVVDQEKNFLITAELPGVPKENIEVNVEGGVLTIKAHVESETKKEKKGQIVHHERYEGRFLRRLDLGSAATAEGVEANLKDGVLKIVVPKVNGKTSKPVKIQVG